MKAPVVSRVLGVTFVLFWLYGIVPAGAAESLVIAASPSLGVALKALGQAYEAKHPGVRVQLYFDNGLDLRRTIATIENSQVGQYALKGKGPIHLLAPGGDELIARMEQKYYVLPGTRRAYALEQLVMIVPEQLVESPGSFQALGERKLRVAIADPERTRLGRATISLFRALGIADAMNGRLDVATDERGVLDHLLSGTADVGIVFGSDAFEQRERVRVVATAEKGYEPIVHSMAMERFCPNRTLCEEFLAFIQTSEAQEIVKKVGYSVPGKRE